MGRDSQMNAALQQHASLQQSHASDNHSMSNINVLSLLDASNHPSLLSKQSNDAAQQYGGRDSYLTHQDLVARSNGISNGIDHTAWNNVAKAEPVQDSRMGARTPDHHGATENGTEKNMQDLLESVQRRNPMDTHGWKVGFKCFLSCPHVPHASN